MTASVEAIDDKGFFVFSKPCTMEGFLSSIFYCIYPNILHSPIPFKYLKKWIKSAHCSIKKARVGLSSLPGLLLFKRFYFTNSFTAAAVSESQFQSVRLFM